MFHSTVKQLFRELEHAWRRVEQGLLALGAERRCALRLDRVADRLVAMGERIDLLRARMQADTHREAIDPDGALRAALAGLKEDIRGIRCQLAAMHSARLGARMQRAFARLSSVAEHTFVRADRLQWDITEHEQLVAAAPAS
ncbi:MAG: hypothetical protein ACJ8GW_18635 [Massilia sp.]